ncbi:unnamed protein product [Brassicogethes aeneus]|uniref:Pyruvate kinase n=1 Tax=Brassicogethes aeneus TaxID=1431903 RepID=A0A9P0FS59_BRAAE|nr:unnamed protein product [Brassicogethes aeneus]
MYNNYDVCPQLPWMVDFHATDPSKHKNQLAAAFAPKALQHLALLDCQAKPSKFKATKILATITNVAQCNTIESLCQSGLSGVRMVFEKFETWKEKRLAEEMVSKVKVVNENYSKKIGRVNPLVVMMDIPCPKIHIGTKREEFKRDALIEKMCTTILKNDPGNHKKYSIVSNRTTDEKLASSVEPEYQVKFDDRLVPYSTIKIVESVVDCIVQDAADIFLEEPTNVPDQEMNEFTVEGEQMIKFASKNNIDVVILSKVQTKRNVTNTKKLLHCNKAEHILIIPKIDNAIALDNFDEILEESDGICLDCGQLMLEIPREKVFLAQKSIVAKCQNKRGKVVIVTTEVVDHKSFSKSEICDLANSIIEAIDGLLLSDEATTVNSIKNLTKLCKEAEPAIYHKQLFNDLTDELSLVEPIYSLVMSTVNLSLKCNASAIILTTSSGRTAKLLSMFRPRCPIVAITRHRRVCRQLQLFRSVHPVLYTKQYQGDWLAEIDDRLQLGVTYGKLNRFIYGEDVVVTVSPVRPDSGFTNNVRVFFASYFDDSNRVSKGSLYSIKR